MRTLPAALPVAVRPRSTARARVLLALLLGGIALVIAGLLGMHAMGASASGHGSAVPTAVGAATGAGGHGTVDHGAMDHAASDPSTSAAQQDAQPAPAEHDHIAIACVLALLVGLLVLTAPLRAATQPLLALRPTRIRTPAAVQLDLPPPSLERLSISRT
ncbi:DUF6153 family protein [Agrococcus terreus]|uniref:DUF6153 family protein n=1 Tax=Agrococcus terreus TaxID=574649 RepID=UPI0038514D31